MTHKKVGRNQEMTVTFGHRAIIWIKIATLLLYI